MPARVCRAGVKVGLFVNTPAQVHFFRPVADELRRRGHEAVLLARYHPEARRLLDEAAVPHVPYATPSDSKWGKLAQLPRDVAAARRLLRRLGVQAVAGFGVYDVLSSAALRLPSVVFTDTETRYHGLGLKVQYAAFTRLATVLLTPAWFRESLGRRHERLRTFKEVAYLHPDRFQPNRRPEGLGGLDLDAPFAFLRLSAHGALHDAGHAGLAGPALQDLLRALQPRLRVWASFEGGAPPGLEHLQAPIQKGRIHDVLYHAAVVIGDSGSIPAEAALLGTPSLRFTTRPPERDMGGFLELERVGLMETFRDSTALARRAADFPLTPGDRARRRQQAQDYLRSLVDPVAAVADRLEQVTGATAG